LGIILKIKNIKICVNTLGSRLIFKVFSIRLEYFINILLSYSRNQNLQNNTILFVCIFLGRNQRFLTFSFMSVHARLSNIHYWHHH